MENAEGTKTIKKEKVVVGIDVGTTKIAVFIGKKNDDGTIEIIGMGKTQSVGVERGVVRDILHTADSIKKAVAQAEEHAGYKVTEAFVGIAGHHIKSKQHRGNKIIKEDDHIITEEDIKSLIEEQYNIIIDHGEQIIDIVPQNYIIDGDEPTKEPVGRVGKYIECNFNLISGDVNNIKNIYRSVEMAGYKVKNLILEPISSAEAVVNSVEKDAGICLVDIGGGTTDMAIFHEGILRHTYVIPLAGNVITNDIRKGCSIINSQAETLKVKFGDCIPTDKQANELITIPGLRGRESREITMQTLSNIIKQRIEQILEQVLFEIKNADYDKKLIGGIVLTGGGAMIQHISQLTEYVTGISTRIGSPDEHLSGEILDEMKHPMHATGIGLVLKGFQYIESEKNEEEENKENKEEEKTIQTKEQEQTKPINEEQVKVEEIDSPKIKEIAKNKKKKEDNKNVNGDNKPSLIDKINAFLRSIVD